MRNGRFNAGDVTTSSTGGGAIQTVWRIFVTDSTFENNSVVGNGSGGAIRATSVLDIVRSEFIENTAVSEIANSKGRGGAVYSSASTGITNTLFARNRADAGGAYYDDIFNIAVAAVTKSTFTGNFATELGGAIWSRSRRLSVINSTLTENSGSGGGAVYSQRNLNSAPNTRVSIEFSTIVNNTATSGSGGGGVLSAANSDGGMDFISSIIGGNKGLDNSVSNCATIGGEASVASIFS